MALVMNVASARRHLMDRDVREGEQSISALVQEAWQNYHTDIHFFTKFQCPPRASYGVAKTSSDGHFPSAERCVG